MFCSGETYFTEWKVCLFSWSDGRKIAADTWPTHKDVTSNLFVIYSPARCLEEMSKKTLYHYFIHCIFYLKANCWFDPEIEVGLFAEALIRLAILVFVTFLVCVVWYNLQWPTRSKPGRDICKRSLICKFKMPDTHQKARVNWKFDLKWKSFPVVSDWHCPRRWVCLSVHRV